MGGAIPVCGVTGSSTSSPGRPSVAIAGLCESDSSRGGDMTVTGQILNHELDALITEAKLSHAALARNVNHLGGVRHGLRLAYDYRSVGRWLRGAIPDPPAPELIAAALAHATGRAV